MRRHHIVFIEDDESEMATFRRLYEGDQFELTGLCIQLPRSVVPALAQALGDRLPDLFVLDLFFPAVSNPPGGLTADTVGDARAHLTRVLRAAEELEGMFIDESALEKNDKELLRAGSELVYWSQRMLRHWCDVLGQSPSGGIALMRILREQYPAVPAVFYSRKATVVDVKAALDAGALDVLIKPHRSLEDAEAPRFREVLTAYCEGHGPAGAAPSADRALPHANTVDRGFARPYAARHGARPLGDSPRARTVVNTSALSPWLPSGEPLCQRSPYSEPLGSGTLSHPGSPIMSQAESPMLSHPGAGKL